MSNIPQEQPPIGEDQLREWLSRLAVSLNGAFDNVYDLTYNEVPEHVIEGMVRLLRSGTFPGVNWDGPYIYVNGQWWPMTADTT